MRPGSTEKSSPPAPPLRPTTGFCSTAARPCRAPVAAARTARCSTRAGEKRHATARPRSSPRAVRCRGRSSSGSVSSASGRCTCSSTSSEKNDVPAASGVRRRRRPAPPPGRRRRRGPRVRELDFEGVFNEDYLYFYEDILGPERTREDVEKIVDLLELEPGAEVLDCPCGHGRVANAIAEPG